MGGVVSDSGFLPSQKHWRDVWEPAANAAVPFQTKEIA